MPRRADPDTTPTVHTSLSGPHQPRRGAGWRYQVGRAHNSVSALVVAYLVVIIFLQVPLLILGRWR